MVVNMGLLDTLFGQDPSGPQSQAMGQVINGLLAGNFRGGLLGANQVFANEPERKRQAQLQQMQMEKGLLELGRFKREDQQAQTEQQRLAAIRQALPSLFRQPGMTGGQAMPQEVGGLPMFSKPMGAAPMQATPGGFDVQQAIRLGMDPDEITKYAGLSNIGKPKVARTVEVMRNGKPTLIQLDESGQEVGGGFDQWKAPVMQNLGGRTAAIDPVSLAERGSFAQTMSPAEREAAFRASQNQNKPAFHDGQFVYAPTKANPQGSSMPVPGFQKTSTATPSEGERKAATLLQRLNGSQAQLTAALGGSPGAAKPEIIPAMLGKVAGDTAANLATSGPRQQVEAAQLDMLDAALTLGTGAAYTREQLEGYRKSYFPQIGDDQKTVADKQARLQNVIEAAKLAAGRAAPGTPAPSAQPAPPKVNFRYVNGKLQKVD